MPLFDLLNIHRHLIANDLSSSAVEAMKRNFEFNGLMSPSETEGASIGPENKVEQQKSQKVKVTISESDAWYVYVLLFRSSSITLL
jgi:tRNA G26 N,N-dimethylase Trm1